MSILRAMLSALLIHVTRTNPIIGKQREAPVLSLRYSKGTLKCVSSPNSSDYAAITWYQDNIEVMNQDLLINPATLNLTQLNGDEEHEYTCEKAYQNITLHSEAIVIMGNKYISLKLVETEPDVGVVKLTKNRSAIFHAVCHLRSYPEANLHFWRNEHIVAENERISITKSVHDDGSSYELTIKNISQADVGGYHCQASNNYVSTIISANAIVLDGECSADDYWKCPTYQKCLLKTSCKNYEECIAFHCDTPADPRAVKVIELTYSSALLNWSNDFKTKEYTIIADTDNSLSQAFRSNESKILLSDLKNDTHYTITIYASNDVGMSDEVYFGFKTKRMVPPMAVKDPTLVRKKNQTIFKWEVPEDDGMNSDGDLIYKMQYCLIDDSSKSSCVTTKTKNTSMDLSKVDDTLLYLLSITPINIAGQEGEVKSVFYNTAKEVEGNIGSHSSCLLPFGAFYVVISVEILLFL